MSAWAQLEQLLTCAICLDRFRNPKLLPCQHTFCGEPCMEGLIDYARRQIKCPECRAEHRIPYQGIQTFPTNVTLMRFLELHRSITGEEPEPLPSQMERCGVCSEKSCVEKCAHCDKKLCEECKEAHVDILKREINRINGQIKRGLGRLSDYLSQAQKNAEKLQQNSTQVRDEIEEIVRRYVKDVKDKEEKLIHELEVYVQNELRTINKLKEDLEVEVTNMTSNCELADKYFSDDIQWTDAELVEYKEIFLKMLEFLRNFDPDTSDFSRRVKFQPKTDLDMLHKTLKDFGELKINAPTNIPAVMSTPPPVSTNALMRSQSDHRLAVQFQKRQEASRSLLDVSQRLGGHASDSERDSRDGRSTSPIYGRNRRDYGDSTTSYRRYSDRGKDYESSERDSIRSGSRFMRDESGHLSTRNWREPEPEAPSGFRSRFLRDTSNDDEDTHTHGRSVRFSEEPTQAQRPRIFDTEDAIKGPLSGVVKLADNPHVLERLHQNEARRKAEKKEQERRASEPTPTPLQTVPRRPPSRQVSEDEIEKQKKQNQLAAASTTPSTPTTTPQTPAATVPDSPTGRPVPRRLAALQKHETPRVSRTGSSDGRGSDSSSSTTLEEDNSRPPSRQDSHDSSSESVSYRTRTSRRRSSDADVSSPPEVTTRSPEPVSRSQRESLRQTSRSAARPTAGKSTSLDQDGEDDDADSRQQRTRRSSLGSRTTSLDKKDEDRKTDASTPTQSSFYSRIMAQRRQADDAASTPAEKEEEEDDEDDDEESESESDSEVSSSDSGSEANDATTTTGASTATGTTASNSSSAVSTARSNSVSSNSVANSTSNKDKNSKENDTGSAAVSSLLNRSAQARRDSMDLCQKDGSTYSGSRLSQYARDKEKAEEDNNRSSYRYRRESLKKDDDYSPSSYLASRRRSAATVDEDNDDNSSAYSRYLSRSRSSALLGSLGNSRDESPDENRTSSTDRYGRRDSTGSRYGNSDFRRNRLTRSRSSHSIAAGDESGEDDTLNSPSYSSGKNKYERFSENALARSRSHHALKSREQSPTDETTSSTSSSWAQYLRNKYGSRNNSSGSGRSILRSRSSHALYSRSGSDNSSDDEGGSRGNDSVISRYNSDSSPYNFSFPRSMYMQKKKMLMRIGTRGTEPNCFTWPRGVAVGPDNSIVVADSSNHRVQIPSSISSGSGLKSSSKVGIPVLSRENSLQLSSRNAT